MNKLLLILIILFSSLFGSIGGFLFLNYSVEYNIQNQKVNNLKTLEGDISSLVQKVSPSVVSIVIKKDLAVYKSDPWGFFQYQVGSIEKQVGGGTGFFISKDGIIITNKHVVSDSRANYTVILNDGTEYDAQIIAAKRDNDLAFLQIESQQKDFQALQFINAEKLKIGQFAIAIGNALSEFQNSVSFGVVSGLERKIQDNYIDLEGLIQTDAAINPGNSGGPLLNLEGKVMGINTAIINGSQNIGFAIQLSQDEIDIYLDKIKN